MNPIDWSHYFVLYKRSATPARQFNQVGFCGSLDAAKLAASSVIGWHPPVARPTDYPEISEQQHYSFCDQWMVMEIEYHKESVHESSAV